MLTSAHAVSITARATDAAAPHRSGPEVRGYAHRERAVAYEQTQLDIPLEPVAVWLITPAQPLPEPAAGRGVAGGVTDYNGIRSKRAAIIGEIAARSASARIYSVSNP
jgi:hypothetical protein